MALATLTLQNNLQKRIKKILDLPFDEKSNSEEIKLKFSEELSKAISEEMESWIKTANVIISPGILVSTTGSAIAQTGATTSVGKGNIE